MNTIISNTKLVVIPVDLVLSQVYEPDLTDQRDINLALELDTEEALNLEAACLAAKEATAP